MNHFSETFNSRIKKYWDNSSETVKQQLLDDILQYANSNSLTFIKDLNEIRFDKELLPLPLVLEALSKDTDQWGLFYVDLLDDIFVTAKQVEKPNDILTNLTEFCYIEEDKNPFIQQIADRLLKELGSENLETKLAATRTLIYFLPNNAIRNKSIMIERIQQQLTDMNWKIRVATFYALKGVDLLPSGHKLSIVDKLYRLVLGAPPSHF